MALISGIGSPAPTPTTHTRTPDQQVSQPVSPAARSLEKAPPAQQAVTVSQDSKHTVDVTA
jgi:hypothetical protein